MFRSGPLAPLLVSLSALVAGLASSSARAAIRYTGESHSAVTSNASMRATFSRAIASAGQDHYFVVAFGYRQSAMQITGVSYDGVAMTRLGSQGASGSCRIELFGLVAPTADDAAHNVVATVTGAGVELAYAAFDFTGVDPNQPTAAYSSRTGGSGQPSLTIAHAAGEWLVVNACHEDAGGIVQSNYAVTQEQGWGFTGAAGGWAIGGVPLLPVGAAAPLDAGAAPDMAGVPFFDAAGAEAPAVDVAPAVEAPLDGGPAQDAGDGAVGAGAAGEDPNVALQVGCACSAGRAGSDGVGAVALLALAAVALRRRLCRRRAPVGPPPSAQGGSALHRS